MLCITVSPLSVYSHDACADGIHTWTDEHGVTHFSDQAPAHGQSRQLELDQPVLVPMKENLDAASAIDETVATSPSSRRGEFDGGREAADRQRRQCEQYRQELDNIQSRLRAGYGNAEGNRLRARRRVLSGRLGRECILG
ncbi:DUF4124 domain-containing protein [Marinobacter sp. M1N3S26]|uniref:DUF4124 domain-containing protein n=1 Tax=unclassified Marinobacter TaxID=83889 RepID=UPI00387B3368